VDSTKVSASFQNGVLTIVVPKAEQARPREIPVRAG
jgi:HSP20 family molecular chaperone IbpA